MAKKIGLGCTALLGGLALLFYFVMWATSGVTGKVDEFIEHLAQDRHDQAYSMLGSQITSEMKREAFEDFLVGTRLRRAKSGSWSGRSVKNGIGSVNGTVTLKDGGTVDVRFYLEKTNGNWLIEGIHLDEKPFDPKEAEEFKALGNTFVDHLSKGEVEKAYALFGDQLTKDLDAEGFADLLSATGLDKAEKVQWMVTDSASMGGIVKGTVTTRDGGLIDLKLNLERISGGWMIQGLDYQTKNGGGEILPLPTKDKALEWSKAFVSSVAHYMDKNDPKPLAELCHSSLAEKLIKEDALAGVIAKFPDPAGLRKILDAPIVLTKKPQLTETVYKIEARTEVDEKGHYLTFQLDFSGEEGQWRIVNLNLQTRTAQDERPAEAWGATPPASP